MLIPAIPSTSDTSVDFFLQKSSLQPIGHSSCTRHGWFRLAPIDQYFTAASRRSLVRVSVPVWGIILSDPLDIVGLVSRYLTNYLMSRMPIYSRRNFNHKNMRIYDIMGY